MILGMCSRLFSIGELTKIMIWFDLLTQFFFIKNVSNQAKIFLHPATFASNLSSQEVDLFLLTSKSSRDSCLQQAGGTTFYL